LLFQHARSTRCHSGDIPDRVPCLRVRALGPLPPPAGRVLMLPGSTIKQRRKPAPRRPEEERDRKKAAHLPRPAAKADREAGFLRRRLFMVGPRSSCCWDFSSSTRRHLASRRAHNTIRWWWVWRIRFSRSPTSSRSRQSQRHCALAFADRLHRRTALAVVIGACFFLGSSCARDTRMARLRRRRDLDPAVRAPSCRPSSPVDPGLCPGPRLINTMLAWAGSTGESISTHDRNSFWFSAGSTPPMSPWSPPRRCATWIRPGGGGEIAASSRSRTLSPAPSR